MRILGATSGDTGSAAIHGMRGKNGVDVFMLHPKGRVSIIQERQMTTVLDSNIHNFAVEGTFDDAQRIVKALFNDSKFKQAYHLGSVNSINWARILAQNSLLFLCMVSSCQRKIRTCQFCCTDWKFWKCACWILCKMHGFAN